MERPHLLLSLPTGLAAEIITVWLHAISRVKLDSAHCNRSQRNGLLVLLQTHECAITDWVYDRGNSELTNDVVAWANVRNVTVTKISLSGRSNLDLHDSYFRKLGTGVTDIKAHGALSKALSSISYCTNLLKLDLTMCKLSSALAQVFRHCRKLKEFRCVFRGRYWRSLPADTVTSTDFDGVEITNLKLLSLSRCCDPTLVAAMVKSAVQVQTLLLYNPEGHIHADIVNNISCTANVLSLTQLNTLPEGPFCAMVERCQHILHLDLSGTTVTTKMATAIGTHCPLQSLGLSYSDIDDDVLLMLVGHCAPTLRELILGGVKVQVLRAVLQVAAQLKILSVQCQDHRNYPMDWSLLRSLTSLSVMYTGNRQSYFLSEVSMYCTTLQHLQLNLDKVDFQVATIDTIVSKCTTLRSLCVEVRDAVTSVSAMNAARWQCMSDHLVVSEICTVVLSVLQELR